MYAYGFDIGFDFTTKSVPGRQDGKTGEWLPCTAWKRCVCRYKARLGIGKADPQQAEWPIPRHVAFDPEALSTPRQMTASGYNT